MKSLRRHRPNLWVITVVLLGLCEFSLRLQESTHQSKLSLVDQPTTVQVICALETFLEKHPFDLRAHQELASHYVTIGENRSAKRHLRAAQMVLGLGIESALAEAAAERDGLLEAGDSEGPFVLPDFQDEAVPLETSG